MGEEAQAGWSGGCQCGALRFHAKSLGVMEYCHCRMCQKAFGTPGAALIDVPAAALKWTRGQPAEFRSSPIVARGFCPACGTSLYMHEDGDLHIEMAVGSFDHPETLPPPVRQSGVESRLPWFTALASLPDIETTATRPPEILARLLSLQHPDHDTPVWPVTG